MWQNLSLRGRINLLLALLLALGLAVNIARQVAEAGPRVQAEDQSVIRLAREFIEMIVADLNEAPDPDARLKRVRSELTTSSCLEGSLKIPDAAGKLELRLDLRARKIQYSTMVDAPDNPRAQTRINWLMRELRSAPVPDVLVVFVDWSRRGVWSEHPYGKAKEQPQILFLDPQGNKIQDSEPTHFRLVWTLALPKSDWMQQGGRVGSHSEHLGHLLSELQSMQRTFPGATW